jgi:hypothetical protein
MKDTISTNMAEPARLSAAHQMMHAQADHMRTYYLVITDRFLPHNDWQSLRKPENPFPRSPNPSGVDLASTWGGYQPAERSGLTRMQTANYYLKYPFR